MINLRVMSLRLRKINNVTVKKMKYIIPDDTRPVKGWKLFPLLRSRIFYCAKQKSGKSTTIFKTVKACVCKRTKIIVFCSTIHNDKCWLTIKRWCENKGIDFEGYTSIFDSDEDNILEALVKSLEELREGKEETGDETGEGEDGGVPGGLPFGEMIMYDETGMGRHHSVRSEGEKKESKEKKPRKTKFQELDYMIIFDDLSLELKNKWVTALVKVSRHWPMKILLSSQSINDLAPSARAQMDYTLLYKGMPKLKIEEVLKSCALPVTFEGLMEMYNVATAKQYNFLWIDCKENEYRQNFNTEILVPPKRE